MTKIQLNNVYVISALATIGGLIQGFDVSSMSAIIGTSQYKTYFHHPNSVMQGGITASMAGGSMLGSIFSTFTSDRFGRRDTLFGACIIWIIGSSIMTAVQSVAMLIVARIINGFAVGMLTSQGPIFIAEISPPKMRGRLISLQQWMITWGILIMYFVSYGTSFIQNNASFRLPWALQMIPALALLIFLPAMPRSPRWLASKDRWEEATAVLARLHAKGNEIDPFVIAEINQIRETISLEAEFKSVSWLELVRRRNIIRTTCAIFSHIWSQYTGTNAMMYYIVYIFEMAGLTGNNALLSASIQYVINVIMTLPALMYMDHWPRRRVMMSGSFIMAVLLFTEGAIMGVYGQPVPGGLDGVSTVTWVVHNKPASRAIIACSYLFIAAYAPTWGPVGWIYSPEITPLYIRSKTVSLATFFNWLMNFSLTFFTPPGFQHIQWKMFLIFGTFCCAAIVHVFLLFPESCGKTLEEMDDIFNQSIWAFKVKNSGSKLERDVKVAEETLQGKGDMDLQHLEEVPPAGDKRV